MKTKRKREKKETTGGGGERSGNAPPSGAGRGERQEKRPVDSGAIADFAVDPRPPLGDYATRPLKRAKTRAASRDPAIPDV